MNGIHFGTCSWKYDSWQGIIYSPSAKRNYLAEYSKTYESVEIDQWFWSLFGVDKIVLPLPEVVREYAESVPPDFRFTIKIPNSITLTHFYRKQKDQPLEINPYFLSYDIFERFIELLKPLHAKIGVMMFQFEYLNKLKMESQSQFQDRFGSFINRYNDTFNYGIEIRNPNYLNRRYFEFLKSSNLGHVFLQGYYMPDIFGVYARFRDYLVRPTVIRLHGPDRSDIEEKSKEIWNRILEPKEDDLNQLTRIIEEMRSRNLEVYINVNNHYEGSAPLTIGRIQERLGIDRNTNTR